MATNAETRPWLACYAPGDPADLTPEFDDALALFRAAATRAPERPAIRYFDTTLSYAELDALSDALAVALVEAGMRPGDRVALFLQNVPQFVIGEIAAWKAGGIAVSINPMNRERELGVLLADCEPVAIIAHDTDYAGAVGKALAEHPVRIRIATSALDFQTRNDPRLFDGLRRHAEEGVADLLELTRRHAGSKPAPVHFPAADTALLVYTSGTTGVPKGAMNTHGNVCFTAQVYRDWIHLPDGSAVLGLAPLFHVTGLIGHIALAWLLAGPLVLSYRFNTGVMIDSIIEHQPAFTIGSITALIAIMNHPGVEASALASFQAVYSGGAAIPPAVVDAFRSKFGLYIRSGYGLTETTSPATVTPRHLESPVDPDSGALSVGVPTFNTAIRIGDPETGVPLPRGQEGEILIKGPQVVPGYWKKPDKTAQALHDGWLATGDIGVMNDAGWVFVIDRKKDMINASGYKVWPREVEDVLYTHPAVREAAVVSFADTYRGESVKAVLSLKAGTRVTEAEIIDFCKQRMAAYKYPRKVEFLPELPKTATGKILRRQLRG
ncbi:MAG: long-chain fatty acid--CoA ligase [Nevskiaceae bacterium]|nr:MAG: long-chain fatty acid--CoA ligase [Nevskiaceae bacterium]TBR71997.1 MAG: long-chain fatty acid--CoA ligase [Nevskiaceae bacterium]